MSGGRPLLSVAVYTYNQERFVTETLDSLLPAGGKGASSEEDSLLLRDTELVVSDDCSSDGTAGAVDDWMERYGARFSSCRLLRGERNEGPVRNYIRAVRGCSGEIIKPLAGDDLFRPGGLRAAVSAMTTRKEMKIAFGRVAEFSGRPAAEAREWTEEQRRFFAADVSEQFRTLVSFDPIPAPGVLFRRELFESLRLWEHDFFWMEDWPLWLLATSSGFRIYGLEYPVVSYRIHAASLSQRMNTKGRERVRRGINADRRKMYDEIVLPRISGLPLFLRHHVRLRRFFFFWLERSKFPGLVHWVRSVSLLVDPHRLRRKIAGAVGRGA
jgi:glycosyltransferase involved in cell wall biosynthesis